MASTSNAYDFDLFDSRDHGSAAPKLPEPKAPQKQKQKNNVVKLDEKQLRRSHRHSANTVKMLMNLAVVLVIVGAIGAVVFSQVQLTELTDEINTANESLSQEKSIAIQLEMQAASKLNTEEIEQIARGRQGKGITEVHIVGGVHPDHGLVADGQTSYISLTQDDEGTVVQAEKTPNLLDRIWQVLQSLFS